VSELDFVVSETRIETFRDEPRLLFGRRVPRWLERVVRASLRWLQVYVERHVSFRSFTRPRADELLERMHLNQEDIMRLYSKRARYVFVGPEMFDEMLRQTHMMSLGSLDGARFHGPQGMKSLMGVEVVMVPWMEGALLVPEWRSHD